MRPDDHTGVHMRSSVCSRASGCAGWPAALGLFVLTACGDDGGAGAGGAGAGGAGSGGAGGGGHDAAVESPDSAILTPDAAGSSPDAAGSAPDATGLNPDAAGSTPDATGSNQDAADSTPDAAGSTTDAAGSTPDAAGSTPDAASSPPDAAGPTPDALGPLPDAASGPVLGAPIDAPRGRWSWVDFPDSTCDDGSPTGIGVYPGDGPGVVVFLNGGGLCWDAQTCLVLHTSTSGPYGAAQFAQMSPAFAGTILDPGAPDNPFRGWSYVFVPYCTGDAHTGDRRVQYDAGGNAAPQDFDHTGGRNLDLFFSRIAATWAAPANFALVGPSAGGFGALVNYAHVRDFWRAGRGFLLSDGFPPLRGDALDDALQAAWNLAWGLDARLTDLCAGCAADPSLLIPTLGAQFPGDRLGLTGTTRDAVLPTFFGLTVEAYGAALADAQTQVYDAVPNARSFTVEGAQHTLLLHPSMVQQSGVTLQTWLTQMISGDAAWANVRP